mmetsp:Transcript_4153/g.10137  ORF Transcript_4153/g.10137 Transcript_4153/m.10137 type:complete len:294 (-) Transcript_4153:900-1781(-)
MIIPTQEWSPGEVSSPSLDTGLMGLLLPVDQRCSMGAGAGMPSASIISRSSRMYRRSARVFFAGESPVRNAISYTCCCPPQSKPRIWSLQSHRVPAFLVQNSASATLHRLTCCSSKGATFSNSSRSCPKPSPVGSTRGATSFRSATMGASLASSVKIDVGSGGSDPSGSGFEPTITTVSVWGTHMYRMCWNACSHASWLASTSACVAVHVCSSNRWAGTHCMVISAATPSAPTPQRAMRNVSGSLSSLSSRVPLPGVTSVIRTTVSSSGGMAAPVPCAPTCVNPPICCSRMDA